MSQNRREFVRNATTAAAIAIAGRALAPADLLAARLPVPTARAEPPAMDPVVRELLLEALDTAKRGG